jgi:iron complex outermembrane receptor protein
MEPAMKGDFNFRRTRAIAAASLLVVLAGGRLVAQGVPVQTAQDLKRLSLEQLMEVEISTISRAPEPVRIAPAAVFVITQDDIRRSGATSLPEALRLAPGLHVARIDSARWAIGMRGFADRLARSMLVLVDGRAVYSPLFAGTYWEVQDTSLSDVDRIEVIRGPGGTLWGANAVNGIINIVTKHARDTQGVLLRASAGADEPALGVVRYGRPAGRDGHVRAYVKAFGRSAQFHPDDVDYDDWWKLQGGFRGDWSFGARALTVQGDVYGMELGQRVTTVSYVPPFSEVLTRDAPLSGGNVLARWTGRTRAGTGFQLQTYYDRTRRDETPVAETRDTFDVDYQQRQRPWRRQEITWGLGYRVSAGRITTVEPTAFSPANRTDNLYSAFVQDEIAIARDTLRLALGTKLEHNAYSGFEMQPSGRLVWTMNPAHTFVWSVTRAVRTPSRVETDYTTTSLANPALPAFVRLLPNPAFRPEELVAYEAGYRVLPGSKFYGTASLFFNQFDNLLSTELAAPFVETSPGPARLILPVSFLNGLYGNSHGIELTADARPAAWLRATANYSYLRVQITPDPGSRDVSQQRRYEGLSPRHQLQITSSVELPRAISIDWLLRYVSALPAGPIPAYSTSDVRIAWVPAPNLELALVGRNLHEARHVEWPAGAGANVQIRRTAYVSLTWRQ